jgi:hypothetical protein
VYSRTDPKLILLIFVHLAKVGDHRAHLHCRAVVNPDVGGKERASANADRPAAESAAIGREQNWLNPDFHFRLQSWFH